MYAYKDRICNDAFVLESEIKKLKNQYIYGLGVASLPLGRRARVRMSARGLPTVWSEGQQIAL